MGTPIVRTPFFEIGVKNYLHGDAVLDLARAADESARTHDVDVLFIAPTLELRRVCEATERLIVLAPHMDLIPPGRGLSKVLPEGIKDAGAAGVVLNHIEDPLAIGELRLAIARARDLGLLSFVCADSVAEAVAIAGFGPDIINPEPSDRIGTTGGVPLDFARESTVAIRAVSRQILVEQAAGITSADDVRTLVLAGADGVGVASGIVAAPDPAAVARTMIAALAAARDQLREEPSVSTNRKATRP
ncbi:MAG: triose-phosphate isomerase [Propionicimonas sp.]|uniref:triose-phosphate isomerase n=1 Tax=Propionicimonas sp. TaxID=1955623 RepID=UPI002B1FCBD9|nr:triose-phosphate isomerase [Propionicimonas sp.]MEA4945671.1 triose-phosphate isomerase [Propionicimonas sp.]MEA5053448.1 triose-phosphate isomerase [Propionicimonas sp.]MEA5119445.1 triose-phosphate isomerase [Propionicimonas sp.]